MHRPPGAKAPLVACIALLPALTAAAPLQAARPSGAQVRYAADSGVVGPSRVEYLQDRRGRLALPAVIGTPARFRPVQTRTVNFGFSTAVYWLHLSVQSRAAAPRTTYLSIDQPTLDDVRLYVLEDGVLRQSERAGDELPSSQHVVSAPRPVLPLRLSPGVHYELYLRVASRMGALLVPMQFESGADLEHDARLSLFLNGAFTGLFAALWVYNLFLWLMLRQRAYLYYVVTLAAGYFAATALDGFGAWMLYPSLTWAANQGLVVCSAAGLALNMLLARTLLETHGGGWLDRLLLSVAGAATVVMLSPWILPLGWAYPLCYALLVVASLSGILAGAVRLHDGHPQARFLLWAQLAASLGLIGFALTVSGLLPFTAFERYSVMSGAALQALLMSLALADRIRALQQATRQAKQAARQALQRRHIELERGVEERTRELNEARRRAEYLATTDALTGVYNRRGLMPLFQEAVAQTLQRATPLVVISFDLDHFKRVNDEFGHAEGDRVLGKLVGLTRQLIHPTDLFGRTGGEEFMLVLNMPQDQAAALAERLRVQLQQHLKAGAEQRVVTASFGVAALSRKLPSVDALLLAADAALYRAKHQGRNRVEIYDASNQTTRTRAILQRAGEAG